MFELGSLVKVKNIKGELGIPFISLDPDLFIYYDRYYLPHSSLRPTIGIVVKLIDKNFLKKLNNFFKQTDQMEERAEEHRFVYFFELKKTLIVSTQYMKELQIGEI